MFCEFYADGIKLCIQEVGVTISIIHQCVVFISMIGRPEKKLHSSCNAESTTSTRGQLHYSTVGFHSIRRSRVTGGTWRAEMCFMSRVTEAYWRKGWKCHEIGQKTLKNAEKIPCRSRYQYATMCSFSNRCGQNWRADGVPNDGSRLHVTNK